MNVLHSVATHRTTTMAAKKLIYPAADRNKEPILSVLKRFIVPRVNPNEKFLEIASGSGQHIAHFAPHFPQLTFYPSDYERHLSDSILAHTSHLENVNEPSIIDISTDCQNWSLKVMFAEKSIDYIYCANMIHISPYRCTIGLLKNAGILLRDNGYLFTYGPYAIDGKITPESNVRFDESLKLQNSDWGIRDLRELEKLGKKNDIHIVEIVDMPANNKTIVWQKQQKLAD